MDLCELSGVAPDDCIQARTKAPCGFVGHDASACCSAAASVAISGWTHSSNGSVVMSWELLERANMTLAKAVQRKAVSYGYTHELPFRSTSDPVSYLAMAARSLYVPPGLPLGMGLRNEGSPAGLGQKVNSMQRMKELRATTARAAARGTRRDTSGPSPGLRGAQPANRGRR